MKTDEVQDLMQEYGQSIGSCRKQPLRHRRSIVPKLAALTATAAVVLVAALVLWPQDATAAAMKRVGYAISNASSMESRDYMLAHDGSWREFMATYFQDGMWRYEVRKGSKLANTIILRDGRALTDYQTLDHATLEEADPKFFGQIESGLSALDFVKDRLNSGMVGTERSMSVEPGPTTETYRVVMDRSEDQYHAELVVARNTDLPVRAEVTVTYDHPIGPSIQRFRHEYRFNHSLPSELFAMESNKPVIDLREAEVQLAAQWSKPLAAVGDGDIRDVRVTDDGTLWIASTTVGSGVQPLPTLIETDRGADYVRLLDIVPSSILGKSSPFQIDGRDVVVAGFVPLEEPAAPPQSVKVSFSLRKGEWPGFSTDERKPEPKILGATPSLEIVRQHGDRPSYFVALDLDTFGFQLPIVKSSAVADEFEKRQEWLKAARAHEATAKAYVGFVKYAGYKALESAGRCYRKLGMVADAERVEAAAKELRKTRER